jgi:transcriptional regulator with XRE-family HTH domain
MPTVAPPPAVAPYEGVGGLLRELRTSRQLSLTRLAERAGVAKSTLSRWEAGAYAPRLSELEAVLGALGAGPAERERALHGIAAPRAIRQVRRETGVESDFTDQTIGPPAGGDLLRAMRQRAGIALAQVADRLGVRPTTVGRWERSEMLPPVERWELLFIVLRARPAEQDALISGGWLLAPRHGPGPASPDELQQQFAELEQDVKRGDRGLMELRFLTWEARLWPLARCSAAAWEMLGEGYSRFSQWLFWDGRDAEAIRYANRALTVALRDGRPRPCWLGPVHVHSMILAKGEGHAGAARAMARLRQWLPIARAPWEQALLFRDLATCAVRLGRAETAIAFSA